MSTRKPRFAAAAIALAAAVFFVTTGFDGDDAPRADAPRTDAPPAAAPAPSAAHAAALPSQSECGFDAERSPVPNFAQLVSFTDAMLGDPNAKVTVVEYFDPNCSHCKALHPIMMEMAETYGDRARFVFKPFPLRPNEAPWLMQTEALYAAQQEGKFFPMMEAQMSRQHLITGSGLPLNALRASAEEAGMNAEAMMRKIQSGVFRSHVKAEYEKALAAGLTGTPMVIINGQVVTSASRTSECLGYLIEQAAK